MAVNSPGAGDGKTSGAPKDGGANPTLYAVIIAAISLMVNAVQAVTNPATVNFINALQGKATPTPSASPAPSGASPLGQGTGPVLQPLPLGKMETQSKPVSKASIAYRFPVDQDETLYTEYGLKAYSVNDELIGGEVKTVPSKDEDANTTRGVAELPIESAQIQICRVVLIGYIRDNKGALVAHKRWVVNTSIPKMPATPYIVVTLKEGAS